MTNVPTSWTAANTYRKIFRAFMKVPGAPLTYAGKMNIMKVPMEADINPITSDGFAHTIQTPRASMR